MRTVSNTSLILLVILISFSCKDDNKHTSPPGYDFKAGEKFNMPSSLLEISGIAFKNNKSDTVYSIQDEDGKVFKQKWSVKKQKNVKFARNGDFEDLALLGNTVVALKSNGTLYTFLAGETDKKETEQAKEIKDLIPKAEYEGIYADQQTSTIYVLCKTCPQDKKQQQVTGYIFKYDLQGDHLDSIGTFKVDLSALLQLNPKRKAKLNPSALAKNQRTNEWYILSSMNKMLIVTDEAWKIKAAYKLNSSVFNQPEGLAFDDKHNLFISNEGDEITDGNILRFNYSNIDSK